MHSVQNRLLAGISAMTIAATVGGPALAADVVYDVPTPPAVEYPAQGTKAWVSLEGRFNMFSSNDFDLTDFFYNYDGLPLDPSPENGWGGSFEIGVKPAGMDYDFVGRFTYLDSDGDAVYEYGPPEYVGAEAEVDQTLMLADFEVGRELGVGTRLHAGLRFAHYDSSGEAYYYSSYPRSAGLSGHASFTGIGPRIGIDQRIGLTETVSLDLSAAGAAIYGKRKGDIALYANPGGYRFNSVSDSGWVLNGEASAGLTYSMGNTSITGGYRVDYFSDIGLDYQTGDPSDYFSHGPFLKATFKLGG
ncbi:Lpg1974 family pore-forming outer membrane protein [Oricola sp.]|uniref:Lpg1974 family pore-forming outer membrane protein n=1 Tax=Oricola sp. TaxID=1979950 RepID=UPI000C8F7459|nr:hypothetical protein [Ahrensia sp.]|tara:strand:+ start:37760 stop:38668 length:909 start_codon:yes stop_codon:yes gene_type:complete